MTNGPFDKASNMTPEKQITNGMKRIVLLMIGVALLTGCASLDGPWNHTAAKEQAREAEIAKEQKVKEERRAAQDKAKEETRIAAIDAYLQGKDVSPQIAKALREKELILDMSMEEVKLAWEDEPDRVNVSVGSYGRHEQWVYHFGTYLYFENGKVTSWQESRR